jgi:succinate dehydrogenase / fumarate reductase cytochrome b subunit
VLTAFLVVHLGIAALATRPATFESIAARLHTWINFLPALPFVLLGLLAAESASGMRVLLRGRPAMRRDESPLRLFAQRWTGAVVLVFLVVHLGMALLRGSGNIPAAAGAALFAGSPALVVFYAVCVVAIAWHAGHGMWTGASVWGFRDKRQALWRAVAVVTGLLLALLGFTALRALSA